MRASAEAWPRPWRDVVGVLAVSALLFAAQVLAQRRDTLGLIPAPIRLDSSRSPSRTALAVARFMGALLYEVTSHNLLSYLTASLGLGAVGLLACYVPALRATRVDPLVVLRYQ